MDGLSGLMRRGTRGTRASAVLGWLLVLLAMVSCCSLTAPAAHASGAHPATVVRTITPTHEALARIVVADAPEDRGLGSSCHGTSEHATPVVLPVQSAPAALPGVTATAPSPRSPAPPRSAARPTTPCGKSTISVCRFNGSRDRTRSPEHAGGRTPHASNPSVLIS